jgi:ribonuclease P protein component
VDSRLKRTSRLTDSASFGRVFGKGEKSRDNFFTVLSRDNGKGYARLGLAISRKHCPLATGRNRLKRVVRDSFRRHQGELAGLDIVVLGQPGTSRASNRQLFASLARHWQRIGTGRTKRSGGGS